MIKGFGSFNKSKVTTHKVISDATGKLKMGKFGNNTSKTGMGLKSGTKAAKNPTNC